MGMTNLKLYRGIYLPTIEFQQIAMHVCVGEEGTNRLYAITGIAGDEESEQMAQLFAAAPDLLAALEAIINDEMSDCRKSLADAARAAITKARGAE